MPRAGLPPPVVVVPLGAAAAYRSVLSSAMHATAGAREGGADLHVREGAPQVVRGGGPQVESKTRTAAALLGGVVAGVTPAPRDRIPRLPFVPPVRGRTVTAAVSRRACRGSSPFTDELLPTIHAIVASSPSFLRVALFPAASRGDPRIHHLATLRAKRHWRIFTPVIHVGTQTLCHEPLFPL